MFWKNKEAEKTIEPSISKSEPKSTEEIVQLLETPKPKTASSSTTHSILPCDHFQYEIKTKCGRLARLNQKVMSDNESAVDCDYLNDLFFACRKYTEDPSRNLDCFLKLKSYENDLSKKRIESIKSNDVWTARTEAPSDWNAPLPDWASERLKESYWYRSMNKNKSSV